MKSSKISNILYPKFYKSEYIYSHIECEKELKTLIEQSGHKQEFTRKYRKCLLFLETLRQNCIHQKSFEKLKGNKDLYAIRLLGNKNIRILFALITINNRAYAILLHAFEEKDYKNNSKHSYNKAIKIAERRINQILNIN